VLQTADCCSLAWAGLDGLGLGWDGFDGLVQWMDRCIWRCCALPMGTVYFDRLGWKRMVGMGLAGWGAMGWDRGNFDDGGWCHYCSGVMVNGCVRTMRMHDRCDSFSHVAFQVGTWKESGGILGLLSQSSC
jgi:hypothetical protein